MRELGRLWTALGGGPARAPAATPPSPRSEPGRGTAPLRPRCRVGCFFALLVAHHPVAAPGHGSHARPGGFPPRHRVQGAGASAVAAESARVACTWARACADPEQHRRGPARPPSRVSRLGRNAQALSLPASIFRSSAGDPAPPRPTLPPARDYSGPRSTLPDANRSTLNLLHYIHFITSHLA